MKGSTAALGIIIIGQDRVLHAAALATMKIVHTAVIGHGHLQDTSVRPVLTMLWPGKGSEKGSGDAGMLMLHVSDQVRGGGASECIALKPNVCTSN